MPSKYARSTGAHASVGIVNVSVVAKGIDQIDKQLEEVFNKPRDINFDVEDLKRQIYENLDGAKSKISEMQSKSQSSLSTKAQMDDPRSGWLDAVAKYERISEQINNALKQNSAITDVSVLIQKLQEALNLNISAHEIDTKPIDDVVKDLERFNEEEVKAVKQIKDLVDNIKNLGFSKDDELNLSVAPDDIDSLRQAIDYLNEIILLRATLELYHELDNISGYTTVGLIDYRDNLKRIVNSSWDDDFEEWYDDSEDWDNPPEIEIGVAIQEDAKEILMSQLSELFGGAYKLTDNQLKKLTLSFNDLLEHVTQGESNIGEALDNITGEQIDKFANRFTKITSKKITPNLNIDTSKFSEGDVQTAAVNLVARLQASLQNAIGTVGVETKVETTPEELKKEVDQVTNQVEEKQPTVEVETKPKRRRKKQEKTQQISVFDKNKELESQMERTADVAQKAADAINLETQKINEQTEAIKEQNEEVPTQVGMFDDAQDIEQQIKSTDELTKKEEELAKAKQETAAATEKAAEAGKKEAEAKKQASKAESKKKKSKVINEDFDNAVNEMIQNNAAKESAEAISEEGKAAEQAGKKMEAAAQKKKRFTKANKDVKQSADESAAAIDDEGEAAEKLKPKVEPSSGFDKERYVTDADGTGLSYQNQRTNKSSTNYHTVVNRYGYDEETGELQLQSITDIFDYKKLIKEAETEQKKIEQGQKNYAKAIAAIKNKTLNQQESFSSYHIADNNGNAITLEDFEIKNIDDLDKAAGYLAAFDAEWNTVQASIRKGSSSLNPFVNAINNSKDIFAQAQQSLDKLGKLDQTSNIVGATAEIGDAVAKLHEYVDDQGNLVSGKSIQDFANAYGDLKQKLRDTGAVIGAEYKAEQEQNTVYQETISLLKTIYDKKTQLAKLKDNDALAGPLQDEIDYLEANVDYSKLNASNLQNVGDYQLRREAELDAIELNKKNADLEKQRAENEKKRITDEKQAEQNQEEVYRNTISLLKTIYDLREKIARLDLNDNRIGPMSQELLGLESQIDESQIGSALSAENYNNVVNYRDQRESELAAIKQNIEDQEILNDLKKEQQKSDRENQAQYKTLLTERIRLFKEYYTLLAKAESLTGLEADATGKRIETLRDRLQGNYSALYSNPNFNPDDLFVKNSDIEIDAQQKQDIKQAHNETTKRQTELNNLYKQQLDLIEKIARAQYVINDEAPSKSREAARAELEAAQAKYDANQALIEQSAANGGYADLHNAEQQAVDIAKRRLETEQAITLEKEQQAAKELEQAQKRRDTVGENFERTNKDLANRYELLGVSDNGTWQKYLEQYKSYVDAFNVVKNQDIPTDGALATLEKETIALKSAEREAKKYITTRERLFNSSISLGYEPQQYNGDLDKKSIMSEMKRQLDESYGKGNVAVTGYNKTLHQLYFTARTASGEFANLTMNIDATTGKMYVAQQKSSQLGAAFDRLVAGVGNIGKQLLMVAGINLSFNGLINTARKGIQYVKNIDTALTELKKVTDETEQTYSRFIHTTSASGTEIGSTISDFTQATADFARLGYSIDEAADMAKSAIVFKNVGDGIDTVNKASEDIIATMSAFPDEMNNTMAIVDKYNEVLASLLIW